MGTLVSIRRNDSPSPRPAARFDRAPRAPRKRRDRRRAGRNDALARRGAARGAGLDRPRAPPDRRQARARRDRKRRAGRTGSRRRSELDRGRRSRRWSGAAGVSRSAIAIRFGDDVMTSRARSMILGGSLAVACRVGLGAGAARPARAAVARRRRARWSRRCRADRRHRGAPPPTRAGARRAARPRSPRSAARSTASPAFRCCRLRDGWQVDQNAARLYPQQSCSKLWVAITALDLVDQGKVELDDRVTLGRDDLTLFHQPMRDKILGGGAHHDARRPCCSPRSPRATIPPTTS